MHADPHGSPKDRPHPRDPEHGSPASNRGHLGPEGSGERDRLSSLSGLGLSLVPTGQRCSSESDEGHRGGGRGAERSTGGQPAARGTGRVQLPSACSGSVHRHLGGAEPPWKHPSHRMEAAQEDQGLLRRRQPSPGLCRAGKEAFPHKQAGKASQGARALTLFTPPRNPCGSFRKEGEGLGDLQGHFWFQVPLVSLNGTGPDWGLPNGVPRGLGPTEVTQQPHRERGGERRPLHHSASAFTRSPAQGGPLRPGASCPCASRPPATPVLLGSRGRLRHPREAPVGERHTRTQVRTRPPRQHGTVQAHRWAPGSGRGPHTSGRGRGLNAPCVPRPGVRLSGRAHPQTAAPLCGPGLRQLPRVLQAVQADAAPLWQLPQLPGMSPGGLAQSHVPGARAASWGRAGWSGPQRPTPPAEPACPPARTPAAPAAAPALLYLRPSAAAGPHSRCPWSSRQALRWAGSWVGWRREVGSSSSLPPPLPRRGGHTWAGHPSSSALPPSRPTAYVGAGLRGGQGGGAPLPQDQDMSRPAGEEVCQETR